jgi:hypothetical protein
MGHIASDEDIRETNRVRFKPRLLGQWYEFGFDAVHLSAVIGCQPADPVGVPCRVGIGSLNLDAPPWTFTAPTPVNLSVTDAFLSGDNFTILDFGALVGSTPAVPLAGISCGFDPNVCLTDPAFSHATFLLPAGPHSLTMVVQPAQLLGEGFFRVQAVPEPSYILVIAMFASLLAKSRGRIPPARMMPY